MRLHFGFDRIQRASFGTNLDLDGSPFPGANVKLFVSLPKDLKDQLMITFNNSTRFTKQWLKHTFLNTDRNTKCAGYVNALMSCPKAS